jgi:Flp pilus assembly protein TadB
MSTRSSIHKLFLIALFAWSGLLLFTYFVKPQSALAFIIFLLIVSVALTSTLTIIAYGTSCYLFPSRVYRATIRRAIHQGALLSLAIVLDLILRILHSGNTFTAIMIVGATLVLEVLTLAKK